MVSTKIGGSVLSLGGFLNQKDFLKKIFRNSAFREQVSLFGNPSLTLKIFKKKIDVFHVNAEKILRIIIIIKIHASSSVQLLTFLSFFLSLIQIEES